MNLSKVAHEAAFSESVDHRGDHEKRLGQDVVLDVELNDRQVPGGDNDGNRD